MQEKIYRAFHENIEGLTFQKADSLKAQADKLLPLGEEETDGLLSYEESFIVKFTYESNAIEGSTLTLGETELVLEGEFMPSSDKKLSEVFAARGCADGYEYTQKALKEGIPLTENLIKDIHERTALDCQPRTRGVYRLSPVYIKGSMTVPADAMEIHDLMPTLLYMYEHSNAHPLAKAAAFHAMFENIHPFQDGNGRTGRLILNYMLQKEGYLPIAIKHDAKGEYKSALEKWQVHDNPEPFIQMVNNSVVIELEERISIIERTRNAIRQLTPQKPGL